MARTADSSHALAASRLPRNDKLNPPDWQLALAFTCGLRVLWSAIAAGLAFVVHPASELIRSNALTEQLPAPGNFYYAVLGIWQRFDTLWYLRIAQHGYDLPMAVIFYPLYPAAIRGLSWGVPSIVTALVISSLATYFFFIGLLRLAKTELQTVDRFWLLITVAVWPTSFILFAAYAESLAIALIVWAIWFARSDRWWAASICGLLAGIARPSGVLVCIPLFVMAMRSRRLRGLPVLLAPVGLIAYWAWLKFSGRPSVLEAYAQYQNTPFAAPWQGLSLTAQTIIRGDVLVALQLLVIVLAAAFSFRREFRIEDRLYAAAIIVQMFMYTGRPIIGGARYTLMLYPAFLGLAMYAHRHWNQRQFAFYAAALALLNLAWFVGFIKWSLVL